MLVLIPESLLGERDTDSMRIVSKLLCLQLNLANIERAGLAREAKKAKQRPPVFLKDKPSKREVFGPFRGVPKKMWMKWFGWDYKKVVDKLVYKKIVERNDRYKVDGFPKSYRLAEEYWDEKLILRDINYYIPTTSSIDSNVENYRGPYKQEYQCAESYLTSFKLPDWGAGKFNEISDEYEQDPKKWGDFQRYSIVAMQDCEWWSKVDKNNRHHTPLTTLSKVIRKHVVHDHHTEVGGWDFKNFQPSLLQFYTDLGLPCSIPQEEHNQYFNLCREGKIYEFIAHKMGCKSRDEVKKPMLAMLNIENKKMVEMPIFKCLSRWFPSLCEVIAAIKKQDHRDMSKFLQGKESEIVFGHVVRRYAKLNQPFFTVHDSVITTKKNIEILGNIFSEVIGEEEIETRYDRA